MTDTSAAEARKGKDIQGIPWDRLSISREKYRQTRLEQYKNYENIPHSGERSEKVQCVLLDFCSFWVMIFAGIFLSSTLFVVYRNAHQHIEEGSIMISGKTLDLWNQQYFISKYVSIVVNYIESFQMMW